VKIHAAFLWATTPCSLVLEYSLSKAHISPCKIWGSHSGYEESYVLGLTPCSRLKVNRWFGEICQLHLQDRIIRQARSHQILLPVSCLAYAPSLQMEVRSSSATSVNFQQNTRHCIIR
jgi:hypothetical protein